MIGRSLCCELEFSSVESDKGREEEKVRTHKPSRKTSDDQSIDCIRKKSKYVFLNRFLLFSAGLCLLSQAGLIRYHCCSRIL